MLPERLDLLFVSQWPPSPASIGAQRRVEGLLAALARRHRVTCVSVVEHGLDHGVHHRATAAYCDEVILVPSRPGRGVAKRLQQLRSLASAESFERRHHALPALARALDDLLRRRRFDVVQVESPHLLQYRFRQAPPAARPPALVLDEHNVEFDLARQSRDASGGPMRRLHHAVNWRKIHREELAAWRAVDGVAFTSQDDRARAQAELPSVRAAVIPNAADVERLRPSPDLPRPDGRTVLFFGTLDYFPNQDAMLWFLEAIWPEVARAHPGARLKVVGPRPSREVLAHRGPRVEVAGLVPDLRPHLAEAACVIAPLRVGGGTRFKILEAMAMARPVVSTTLGAEGLGAVDGRELLLADDAASFAAAVGRVLEAPALGERLGAAARGLVEARYSWQAVAADLEAFHRAIVEESARRAA